MHRRLRAPLAGLAFVTAAVALLTVGLTPAVSGAAKTNGPTKTRPAAKSAPPYYVSLGDSYSIGDQPGKGATPGYTAYVARMQKLQLANFGCGGATTTSIISSIGCGQPAATDAVPYPTETQEQAALDFIGQHPGQVSLVTVSIGGNDVTACANAGSTSAILTCVENADNGITANVGSLVSSLSQALATNGDASTRIVGLTYPDVILGDWVYPKGATNQNLASLSVAAFDSLINPTLDKAYTSVADGSFVNVTDAPFKKATAGADTPLTTTMMLKLYGKVPAAVGEVCRLTYYCSQGNIHANTRGYVFIGQLIDASLAPSG